MKKLPSQVWLSLHLSGHGKEGGLHEAPVMIFVFPAIDTLYLSHAAMEQLRIIDFFPEVGSAAALKDVGHQLAACGCPHRSPPPDPARELPFKATAENTEKNAPVDPVSVLRHQTSTHAHTNLYQL